MRFRFLFSYKMDELIRIVYHRIHFICSLDRLLLATLWTLYMFIAWKTDAHDVAYQKIQLQRKKAELLK